MKDKNTTPENFIQPLRHLTLSEAETQNLRERLVAYADLHTAMVQTPAPRMAFGFSSMHFSRSFAVAILMLVFLGGSAGVSYAADSTLPGEPLYAVKVHVNEPLHAALITSPSAKAEYENELAERRLAEATELASQNKLGTTTQAYLSQAVAEHVANSEKGADDLDASGDGAHALAIRSDLEARLSAHVAVLTLMTPRLMAEGDATTTSAVVALAKNVDEARATVTSSRKQTETELSDKADTTDAQAAVPIDTATTTAIKTTATKDAVAVLVEGQKHAREEKEATLLNKAAAKFGFTLPPLATSTQATTSPDILITAPQASSTDESSH